MLRKRLTYLLPSRRRAAELDMQEELQSIAAMAQPGELGNLTVAAEDARAEWGWTRLDAVVQDFRYALRTLWKSRGFSAVAILSLGLGIGANTALFSLVDALLLRSLPIHEPDRVVSVSRVAFELGKKPTGIDAPKLDALRRLDTTFSGVALAASLGRPLVTIDGQPEPARAVMQATGDLFTTLGVSAALGRIDTTSPAVVLGHRYWASRFRADPAVLGKQIDIEGTAYPVVGVAAARFGGLSLDGSVDVWLLAPSTPIVAGAATARLRAGVTIDQALASADGVFRQLERDGFVPIFNGVPARLRTEVQPAGQGNSSLRDQYQKPLVALLALVGLVLVMTCTNVGSLVVVRNAARARELAVRAALGVRG